jgi:hypothetical protein
MVVWKFKVHGFKEISLDLEPRTRLNTIARVAGSVFAFPGIEAS